MCIIDTEKEIPDKNIPVSLNVTAAIFFFDHEDKCWGKSAFSVARGKRNE